MVADIALDAVTCVVINFEVATAVLMTLTLHHPFESDRSVPARGERLIALTGVCRDGHGWGTGLSRYRHRDRRSRRRIGKEGYAYAYVQGSVWVVVKGPFLGFDGWKQVNVWVCRSRPCDACALSEPRSISLLALSLPCYAHGSIAGRLRASGGSREWECRRRNDLMI